MQQFSAFPIRHQAESAAGPSTAAAQGVGARQGRYQGHKAAHGKIPGLVVSGMEARQERPQGAVRDLSAFSTTAYVRFNGGGVEAKREVACAMGATMSLTLGNLGIKPHPLLDVIGRIEPAETGSEKQKQGTSALPNPAWWAMRDDIRTALDKCDMSPHVFKLPR